MERLNSIGKKLVKLVDGSEPDGIGLEFQYNADDRPQPNKILSIQMMRQTGYRKSESQQSPVPSAGVFRRVVVGKSSGATGLEWSLSLNGGPESHADPPPDCDILRLSPSRSSSSTFAVRRDVPPLRVG